VDIGVGTLSVRRLAGQPSSYSESSVPSKEPAAVIRPGTLAGEASGEGRGGYGDARIPVVELSCEVRAAVESCLLLAKSRVELTDRLRGDRGGFHFQKI
jgi:hypothetical protein